jgi:transposase
LSAPISTAPGRKKNSEDQAIGRSRGGLTTKIHALADPLGNPVRLILTAGHVHDVRVAGQLLEGVACGALLGDKGYDADALIERLHDARIAAVIPPRSNRKEKRECDFTLYKERNLIERLFEKLKQFRAIATRYDKLARNFLGAIRLVAAVIQLN